MSYNRRIVTFGFKGFTVELNTDSVIEIDYDDSSVKIDEQIMEFGREEELFFNFIETLTRLMSITPRSAREAGKDD